MVSFGDANLRDAGQLSPVYQAGAGGWPTVRYFNKDTGVDGKPYTKKTGDAMCTELGNDKYMNEYILEAGSTSLCDVATSEQCNEKELEFIGKWKDKPAAEVAAQVARLQGMTSQSMKPELKAWLGQRLNALMQLSSAGAALKDEV